jgi:Flp pilus assembly protein TadG
MFSWQPCRQELVMGMKPRQSSSGDASGSPTGAGRRRGEDGARNLKQASTAGTSLLEFALVVPLFFLLLFGLMDFARLFYVEITLQNALRQAGRYAITGNHLPDPQHQGQNLSRVASIIQIAQNAAQGLDVSSIKVSSLAGGAGSAGGPGDTVTISLTTNLKLMTTMIAQFFKNGTYTFTVSVSFRNEAFPPGNT